MTTNIIQIGSSRGIRIPKQIIEYFKFDKVEFEILPNGLLLKPVTQDISSWDTPKLRLVASKDNMQDVQDDFNTIDTDDKEWQW